MLNVTELFAFKWFFQMANFMFCEAHFNKFILLLCCFLDKVSLCNPNWPRTSDFPVSLPNSGITGMPHYAQA
jgi:hypothetical protein